MAIPKILLADDDVTFRNKLGKFLNLHGFEVTSVQDGYQAVEFAVRESPDLMVLDVHMPAGDGFSVQERLAHNPHVASRPVIFMTHDPTSDVEQIAQEHGAVALLHKPFEPGELLRVVNDALPARAA